MGNGSRTARPPRSWSSVRSDASSRRASGQPLVAATTRRGEVGVDLDVGPRREEVDGGLVGQALDGDRGQAHESVGGTLAVAHAEEQPDAVGRQAAPDERQRGQRLLVDPLGVVDHAQQALLGGHLRQQGEACEPDEEAVGGTLVMETERRRQGVTLRPRQLAAEVEERAEQAVQARVAQVALGLDAGDPDAAQARGRAGGVLEEAGLAHAGLAGDDARPAEATGHRGDQIVEGPPLVEAIQQGGLAVRSGRPVMDVIEVMAASASLGTSRRPRWTPETSGRKVVEAPAIAAVRPGTVRTPPVRCPRPTDATTTRFA